MANHDRIFYRKVNKDQIMKIFFFQFVPHYGGADMCTIEWAYKLKKENYINIIDPHGTCKEYQKAIGEKNLNYQILKKRDSRYDIGGKTIIKRILNLIMYIPHMFLLARKLDSILKKDPPDVILTHNFKSAMILFISRRGRDIPCIYYLHNWYRPPQMNFVGRLLCKYHATKLIAVSYATQNALICAGIPFNKISVIHNPIDSNSFLMKVKEPLTKPLPKSESKVRILLPAGILPIKGHLYAIQAMKEILKKHSDSVLWLAGDNQSEIPDVRNYMTQLENTIKELQLENNVFFIGQRIDIPAVMDLSTHIILPSILEGHPRVILEAMIAKRPVIVTPAGGCTDMVIPGLTGYLADFESSSSLAENIIKAIDNPEKTKEMVERAFLWAKEYFTEENHTKKLLNLLNSIIERKKDEVSFRK